MFEVLRQDKRFDKKWFYITSLYSQFCSKRTIECIKTIIKQPTKSICLNTFVLTISASKSAYVRWNMADDGHRPRGAGLACHPR